MILWDGRFGEAEFYSRGARTIKPSPTLAVAALAKKMQSEGADVIDMSLGEPDFATPRHICNAAISAIEMGNGKYTEVGGTPALKKAIIYRIKEDYGVEFAPDNVIASVGAKHSLFNVMVATLNPEDEVVIPRPYWVSYPEMVALAGGRSVFCDYDADDMSIDVESLSRVISAKTKWLILNSPSNPSGAVYSKSVLRKIADVLLKHPHVNVLSDDVYGKLVYDVEFVNIAQVEPTLWSRMVLVGAVSKTYAMTGWRIGYAAGHKDLVKKMTAIQSQMTSCPSSISQAAAAAALSADQGVVREFVDVFKNRRDIAINALRAAKGIKLARPDGAFYLFLRCAEVIARAGLVDDVAFANLLLEKYHVSSVPGSAFGASGYVRISYAMADAELERGCRRIVKACDDIYS